MLQGSRGKDQGRTIFPLRHAAGHTFRKEMPVFSLFSIPHPLQITDDAASCEIDPCKTRTVDVQVDLFFLCTSNLGARRCLLAAVSHWTAIMGWPVAKAGGVCCYCIVWLSFSRLLSLLLLHHNFLLIFLVRLGSFPPQYNTWRVSQSSLF